MWVGKKKRAHETREDVVRDEVWIKSRDMKGQVRLVSIIRDQNADTVRAARLMSMFVSAHVCVNMCVMEIGPAGGFSTVAAVFRNRCK